MASPFYGGNQAPLSQALQNIAAAMFSRPAVNQDLDDARIAELVAQRKLQQAQAQKLSDDAENTRLLMESRDRNRQTGIAQLISSASGLDQEKAGALALNNRLGFELIPEFNDMNPKEQQLPVRAINMAIGASQLNDPMKVGSSNGAGSTDDIIKGFSSALDSLNKQGVIDGTSDKLTQQRWGFANGRERYDNAGDGVLIDQLETSPIAAVVGNNMKNPQVAGKVNANNALAYQRNSAAKLNTNNARVADLKGNLLLTSGGQDKVVVSDAASPTGFSYALPNGGRASGAPAPSSTNKGTSTTSASKVKPTGVLYDVKSPLAIGTVAETLLGRRLTTEAEAQGKTANDFAALPNDVKTALSLRVQQLAMEAGLSNKFTDTMVLQAIKEYKEANPSAFIYTPKRDTFLGMTMGGGDKVDSYEEAKIADLIMRSQQAQTMPPPTTAPVTGVNIQKNKSVPKTVKKINPSDAKKMTDEELVNMFAGGGAT